MKRAEDYTNFVRAFGDVVVQNEHVDIIQLALQQPKTSFVYLDGLNLARASKTGVYLEWYRNTTLISIHSFKRFFYIALFLRMKWVAVTKSSAALYLTTASLLLLASHMTADTS